MAYDMIVIGAGLSGLLGGIRLAEAGRRVLLLAKGYGTTHWANGAIGVSRDAEPLAGFARLAADAGHPYARVNLATLTAATERLRSLCAAAEYPLAGTLDRNSLLPTAVGATLPAALYPATMASGALVPGQDAGPILIAGFRQLRDFFPPFAAANLRAASYDARAVWLDLPPTQRRLEFTSTVIAELFEDADFRMAVGRQLRAVCGTATRIGLPAVLGTRAAHRVVGELTALAGAPVFEIPTLPPSVPGIRLYDILARAFQRAGGRLQIGTWVIRAETERRRVIAVRTEAAAREARYVADAYLLATGGIAGGGFRTDHTGAIVETAFGLPVRAPADRTDWFGPRFSGEQPIHHAGIATDAALRPIDRASTPLYDNVVVAGAALGRADLLRERSYEGVALATGWHAAATLLNDFALATRIPAGLPIAD